MYLQRKDLNLIGFIFTTRDPLQYAMTDTDTDLGTSLLIRAALTLSIPSQKPQIALFQNNNDYWKNED